MGDYVQMLGSLIRGTRAPADPGGGERTQAVSPPSSAHTATLTVIFYGTREASVTYNTLQLTMGSLGTF